MAEEVKRAEESNTNLPPGRELDWRVAERMGLHISTWSDGGTIEYRFLKVNQRWANVPAYSTDIAAAWELVEYACSKDQWLRFDLYRQYLNTNWQARFGDVTLGCLAVADTAPHAICLAFLALPEVK